MQESVTDLSGLKGLHDPDRSAVRHGGEDGSVTLGAASCPCGVPGCAAQTGPLSSRWPPNRPQARRALRPNGLPEMDLGVSGRRTGENRVAFAP